MRNRLDADKSSDDPLLFWLPPADRFGFWWPKDSVVISKNVVTRVNFGQFVHGEKWEDCYTGSNTDNEAMEAGSIPRVEH